MPECTKYNVILWTFILIVGHKIVSKLTPCPVYAPSSHKQYLEHTIKLLIYPQNHMYWKF